MVHVSGMGPLLGYEGLIFLSRRSGWRRRKLTIWLASPEKGTGLPAFANVDLKTSAALDASIMDTPWLNFRNDTDLIAKVVNSIDARKWFVRRPSGAVWFAFTGSQKPEPKSLGLEKFRKSLENILKDVILLRRFAVGHHPSFLCPLFQGEEKCKGLTFEEKESR